MKKRSILLKKIFKIDSRPKYRIREVINGFICEATGTLVTGRIFKNTKKAWIPLNCYGESVYSKLSEFTRSLYRDHEIFGFFVDAPWVFKNRDDCLDFIEKQKRIGLVCNEKIKKEAEV